MADRVLRGSRMGAVSYETDRDHDLAPRQMVKYRTDDGEIYEVPFAHEAEIPEELLEGRSNHLRSRRRTAARLLKEQEQQKKS